MKVQSSNFWFPVKAYGWGWGPPVRWQGWFVLIGYFVALYFGIRHFMPRHDIHGLLIYLVGLTVLLLLFLVIKGERPAGWRSGSK